jgi:hypothetical protein
MLKPIRLEVWDASSASATGLCGIVSPSSPTTSSAHRQPAGDAHGGLLLREVPFNYGWNWLSFNLAFPTTA